MIPKIIHYCWFGNKTIPCNFQSYIEGWQTLMPEYQVIKWDETNSPIHLNYCKKAMKKEKWANLSNFVRLFAVYEHGGFYLDTDVEVILPFDQLRNNQGIIGFSSKYNTYNNDFVVNNAVMGFVPHHPFIKDCMDTLLSQYDGSEEANLSSPILTTQLLRKNWGLTQYGKQILRGDIMILPTEYFYPFDYGEEFSLEVVTSNTFTVHHWAKTWHASTPNSLKQSFVAIIKHLIKW